MTSESPRAGRQRILVATLDLLTERMAGPAIRAWETASLLGREHDVRLVSFGKCDREGSGFVAEHIEVDGFRAAVEWADVLILQGFIAATFPWLATQDVILVCDLYDPFHLESLEVERDNSLVRREESLSYALRELRAQIARADVILCASKRQRDLWIGHLAAAGRVNPLTYDADPTLDSLVKIVPFGTPAVPAARRAAGIKGVVPGIGSDDRVVLWGGGVYNWFDPLTLVSAIDRARKDVPNIRLFFLGMKHPNPDVPRMRMATRTRALADELGLTGTHVFFNEGWVPYERRAEYLLDADLGVSCHFTNVETEFSFRTRILDYLWAGLPIVSTAGDSFAELVDSEALGEVVPPEDVEALAAALVHVLTDDAARARYSANVGRVAGQFTWPVVLEPLVEFCREPRRAADAGRLDEDVVVPGRRRRTGIVRDIRSTWRNFRAGGIRQVANKVRWRLRKSQAGR
jgi:glycosyltransferase involved in cell wall biosynthesis